MRLPVFMMVIVLTTIGAPVEALSGENASRVDSLYRMGTQLAERDSLDAAAGQFQAAIKLNKKHAPSYVGLGHVYLKKGDLKEAEKAFRHVLRKEKNYAPALNGLGLVFRNTDKMLDWAIKYFRSAYQADRGYIEAYINLAQAYRTIGDTKELDTYQKLVKVDPRHSDAWFQIGRIYTYGEAGRYRNAQKAEAAYRSQLKVNPRHFGARMHLGRILKESGRTNEALALLQPVVAVPNAFQRRALLELAEVHQTARDHDLAEVPLDAYVEGLAPVEKAVYSDLSLVAMGNELTRFQEAGEEERIALSKAFWMGRDPAPATAANERWIEHCRRVAFAREHFGERKFPWDDRGEVYVRYGEPDHISASEDIRFETHPEVLAVKEKLMNQAGEALQHLLLSRRMVSFYREMGGSVEKGMDDQETLSTILGHPVYPVRGVWEYWIYTKVGGGVEVTFVQERKPGPYKYAEMPHAGDLVWVDEITGRDPRVTMLTDEPRADDLNPSVDTSTKSNLIWQRMNPGIVMHRVARKTPEVYVQDFATAPLDFFFDVARFKGEGGPALEVYFGIPTRDLSYRGRMRMEG